MLEVAKGQVAQPRVLVSPDVVFDTGTLAVAALEDGDVGVGLVGEDRLEAVAAVVCEGQLGTRMGALATDDHPRARGPAVEVEAVGEFGDLAVVARRAVLVERGEPGVRG